MLRTLLLLLPLYTCALAAQSSPRALKGAWSSTFLDNEGRRSQLTMTIAEGFMVMTAYNEADGAFISTLGGRWRADPDVFSLTYEFDSSDSSRVGGVVAIPYRLVGNTLIFNNDKFWTRTDDHTPGALAGAWEIVGRKRDGRMHDLSDRRQGPRKTMKILSGRRFQWIAFDTDERRVRATGGGTYTTNDQGLYIEKIDFFSRDPTRVGKQLSFDYQLRNGQWVHRGQSSKGQPVHEVWARRR